MKNFILFFLIIKTAHDISLEHHGTIFTEIETLSLSHKLLNKFYIVISLEQLSLVLSIWCSRSIYGQICNLKFHLGKKSSSKHKEFMQSFYKIEQKVQILNN